MESDAGVDMPLEAQLGIVAVWLVCVGLAAEGLRRFTSASPEVVRKVVHIGAGNVILLAWWLHIPPQVGIAASIVFSIVALLSYKYPILPGINGVGRHSWGTCFYAISIGVLIAWFWPQQLPEYAVIGILIMTWGDGLAALVGQHWGRHPYCVWGNTKSWEGSLAMLGASFAVCSLVIGLSQGHSWQGYMVSLLGALIATTLESFSKLGIDNLTVPIGSAAMVYWLQTWLA